MLTGCVLAGGRSIRMGKEKAWLKVGSRTLVAIALDQLRPHVQRLQIIGRKENRSRFETLGVDVVLSDLCPDTGPLMGVFTGLMASDTPWTLFLPCDMPWMTHSVIDSLMEQRSGIAGILVCEHATEGVQPFPLLCRWDMGVVVGRLLDRGYRSLYALLDHAPAQRVRIQEPALARAFMNVNTVHEYGRLLDASTLAR